MSEREREYAKSTLDCASCFLSYWGHYTYSLHLGHIKFFFTFSLMVALFSEWTNSTKHEDFVFLSMELLPACPVFFLCVLSFLQAVKEICCLRRSSRVVKSVFLRCECIHHIG